MVMCWAYGCTHYNERNLCKFFRIPKDPKIKKRWIKLLRVCSCHFEDNKKENEPTILPHRSQQFSLHHLTPEKKKKRKKLSKQIIQMDVIPVKCDDQLVVTELITNESPLDLSTTSKSIICTDSVNSSNIASIIYESENYFLKEENKTMKLKLKQLSLSFNYENLSQNNELLQSYTGLPTNDIFMALYNLLKNSKLHYHFGWKVESISKPDQLLITLMKLRHNFPHFDLATRFKCNCTEVFTSVSRQSMNIQRDTYSSYKHRNTWKVLVGIAPNGVVTFVSSLFPGSTSDKVITLKSGLLEQLVQGDLILADKGFLIRDILPPGVSLNLPPFLDTPQFTPDQVLQTEVIAKARIHIERAIQKIKRFAILFPLQC
ncbi:Uncharacterized protein FWK35_00025099 [Aphis craccivora]|uniref:THAP-type domain-containing protein n=1 Tax=Aphis craccivora TaxID=307492 RepID=A0A6G0Y4C2_APHCR|nr:Uncharacterized protein FWK35_00025099 [Aphis craccivora]